MSINLASLDGLIAETRVKLDRLERQAEALRVELTAYERARGIVSGELPTRPQTRAVAAGGEGRQRALKREWVQMLKFIAEQPQRTASIDEMDDYAMHEGLGIKRNTLRSQLSIYSGADSGLLQRVGPGRYGITDRGLETIGSPESSRALIRAREDSFSADDDYGARPTQPRAEPTHQRALESHASADDLDDDIPF
jgi:hypothetical protein